MRRGFAVVVAFALVVSGGVSASAAPPIVVLPPPVEGLPVVGPPSVTAPEWILYDDTFDLELASNDADVERPMASTTKIMTALLAFEAGDLDRLVTVSARAAAVGESEIGLVEGEVFPLGTLVRVLLVRSANDAAMAVAEAVGGSVENFVALMNRRAEQLGLAHTHFANPHGLDAEGHYSSARDLLNLARAAMGRSDFEAAVRTRLLRLRPDPTGAERVAEATNKLLTTYDGAIGVKTGFTFDAGRVLVAAAERSGRRLYSVVMGSTEEGGHFTDASALLDYGFDEFGVVPVVIAGEEFAVRRDWDGPDPLTAAGSMEVFVHLASSGLLGPRLALAGDSTVIEPPGSENAAVELVRPAEPRLPDIRDAFQWARRYWDWLVGDG